MTPVRVVLQPRRARPFYGRHPWVYPGAISAVEGEPADGDVVDLHAHEGPFVARGLYNSRSKIRVRLYSWSGDVSLDRAFFRQRLQAALHLRGPILGLNKTGEACRLVFSEADGLSGCTVDRYDRWLVMQFTSLGMAQRRDLLAELLAELVQPEGIYLRTERSIGRLEGLELQDGPLWGQVPAEPIVIEEHGLRFQVNLTEGQKTGFYLDQRDNRAAVARFAAGRRVLDAFCYTGGFALHAARAGARDVEGVDVSEPALALAEANAQINGLEKVRFTRSEVIDRLASLVGAGERYGLVILDPPKFARSRNAVDEAMRGYRRLHAQSVRLLEPDGILVTCCCSGLITRDMLQTSLADVAAEERRDVQLLEVRGQAADHPVAVTCPETDYLKCLVCRVR
ncbi:MAG TPA: class I SAM-dependent rRNA methyltransferase [Gemmataceae bacterium]|jgi:23S rRNA (cytosine1962-C5)-methyltransferase